MKIEPLRTIRYYLLRFLRLKGDPHFLARGVAIGIFIGITPTIPLHTVTVLVVAVLLRSSRIAALLASVLVSNPLTFFPQYYLSWRMGALLTDSSLSWEQIHHVMDVVASDTGFSQSLHALGELGFGALAGLIAGGCILALPVALIAYWLALWFFTTVNRKRLQKHILKHR